MKKIITSTLICSSLLFSANSNYTYEITPLIGGVVAEGNLDLRNQKNYGISIAQNLDDDQPFDQIELGILRTTDTDYSNSNENTKITRYFANIIKDYTINENVSLYTLMGLGYEKFSKERYENENDVFGNYGIGLKYKLSEDIHLKTNLRHLITFEGNNSLLYTLGLGISFGPKAKLTMKEKAPIIEKVEIKKEPIKKKELLVLDDDNDGVINSLDKCPSTPTGAKVNQKGCELDSDQDGVVNSLDKCLNTIKGALVDNTGCAVNVNLQINFNSDSSTIENTYNNKIEEFAAFLKKYPSVKAKIEAHTDATGSKIYNENLSQRRAKATVKALTDLNISPNRLEAIGYGELKPMETNTTKKGRAANRRVEAVIKK